MVQGLRVEGRDSKAPKRWTSQASSDWLSEVRMFMLGR